MSKLFGDTFDFDHNGSMDSFEKRAEYTAVLNEVRLSKGLRKTLSEMTTDEIGQLAGESGIDPSKTGF